MKNTCSSSISSIFFFLSLYIYIVLFGCGVAVRSSSHRLGTIYFIIIFGLWVWVLLQLDFYDEILWQEFCKAIKLSRFYHRKVFNSHRGIWWATKSSINFTHFIDVNVSKLYRFNLLMAATFVINCPANHRHNHRLRERHISTEPYYSNDINGYIS